MRFSNVFMLEIKKLLPLFFLVLVSMAVTLGIAQLSSSSFDVIGAISYSSYGVIVGGYGFNFCGQGVPLTVNITINGFHKIIKSENGTFLVYIPLIFPKGSKLTINITFGKENYVVSKVLTRNFTTFVYAPVSYFSINYNNISVIYVKGKAVVATSLKCIYVNGEKMDVNSTIFVINSDNVKPPFDNYTLTDLQVIKDEEYCIISLLGVNMGLILLTAYYYLSVFPRRLLDLIFRLIGVGKIYLSKTISMSIFTLLTSLPSLIIFALLKGIFLSSIVPYILIELVYSMAVLGISPLVSSKGLVYSSITLAGYLLNLVFYNEETLSLAFLILPLIGYIKLRWVYR